MIGMTRCTKQVLSKGWMTCQSVLPCFPWRRGMSYIWGCINTYLRSQVCSIHSLACKTSSHQVAWWIYRQVDLRCLHSQCKCPLFVNDLLWNDGRHLCALFFNVELDSWWTWWHSHCHIAMALVWIWFQNHSKLPLSKVIEHNNYQPKFTQLRWLKEIHYFASLITKTQVIFPIIDMRLMCSFSQLCIPHNRSPNIQSTQILLIWDTTIQYFVYASM